MYTGVQYVSTPCRTNHFFPSPVALHIPTEEWPGWVGVGGWLNAKTVHLWMVTHLGTNLAWRRVTHWCLQCKLPITGKKEVKVKGVRGQQHITSRYANGCHLSRPWLWSDTTVLVTQLVLWRSGRTLVFDRQAFAVLRSTYGWRVTTYVGKLSAIGPPTRPTQSFILSGSINE